MKYIRAQSGEIYSVSQLMPPKRVTREGEPEWQLKVITVDGQRAVYAGYDENVLAAAAWGHVMAFMGGGHMMLSFEEPGKMPCVEFWECPVGPISASASSTNAAEVAATGDVDPSDVEYVEPEEEGEDDTTRDSG